MGLGLCNCCEVCDERDPHWTVTRVGDAVVSWACDGHLGQVCAGLQRDHEVTKLIVKDFRKACAWAHRDAGSPVRWLSAPSRHPY